LQKALALTITILNKGQIKCLIVARRAVAIVAVAAIVKSHCTSRVGGVSDAYASVCGGEDLACIAASRLVRASLAAVIDEDLNLHPIGRGTTRLRARRCRWIRNCLGRLLGWRIRCHGIVPSARIAATAGPWWACV
jgi:hypothetical protein